MRRALVLLAGVVAACVAAAAAGATNECRRLPVCVPVAGPWVVAQPAGVEFQLSCPKRFVVAGLDAELSRRGVDVTFAGRLGSPVNPGITTTSSVQFHARLLTQGPIASFRPHVGCIPASGGGQRFPTAHRPEPSIVPTAVQLSVLPGVHRYVEHCAAGKHLAAASHAVGFYSAVPPSAALVRSISVAQSISDGKVHVVVRAGTLEGVSAVVQVDMVCA